MKQKMIRQTVFNSFTIIPVCWSHHWKFNMSLHTRELMSHMPNPLDTNKLEVVCVLDSVCANVVRSVMEQQDLWHVPATHGTTYAAHCNCCWFIM